MKLSQDALAEKVDRTTGFIGQLERGESMPSIETLTKIIQVLRLDANELFHGGTIDRDSIDPSIYELIAQAQSLDERKLHLLLRFAELLSNEDI